MRFEKLSETELAFWKHKENGIAFSPSKKKNSQMHKVRYEDEHMMTYTTEIQRTVRD